MASSILQCQRRGCAFTCSNLLILRRAVRQIVCSNNNAPITKAGFISSSEGRLLRDGCFGQGRCRRSFVSPSLPYYEKRIINVPTMGDSITEGTIVEWTRNLGQVVKEGDVVALIETDKVTIDIKSEINGVLVQQFGNVDDTVEVGSNLYEIDTEAEATFTTTAESSGTASSTTEEDEEAPTTKIDNTKVETTPKVDVPIISSSSKEEADSGGSSRVPSIHFLGKDGWSRRRSGQEATTTTIPAAAATEALDALYGRPAMVFTDDEMESLILGGANLAPDVMALSNGAKFK